MDEEVALLEQTARRVFSACGESNASKCHQHITQGGLPKVLVRSEDGGFGGGWCHAFPILFAAGEHALFYPMAETLLAAGLLSDVGLPPPPGIVSLAQSADGTAHPCGDGHLIFSGSFSNVAFGAEASAVVALIQLGGITYAACSLRDQATRV